MFLLVRHKVEDYDKWKSIYDPDAANRKASGSEGACIFRNANDPSELIVLLKWDDPDKAKKFAESEGLRQRMQKGGVIDKPDVYFLDEMEETLCSAS